MYGLHVRYSVFFLLTVYFHFLSHIQAIYVGPSRAERTKREAEATEKSFLGVYVLRDPS